VNVVSRKTPNNRSKGRDAWEVSAASAEIQCAPAALTRRFCAALQLGGCTRAPSQPLAWVDTLVP
jgi:hypothetical protein